MLPAHAYLCVLAMQAGALQRSMLCSMHACCIQYPIYFLTIFDHIYLFIVSIHVPLADIYLSRSTYPQASFRKPGFVQRRVYVLLGYI